MRILKWFWGGLGGLCGVGLLVAGCGTASGTASMGEPGGVAASETATAIATTTATATATPPVLPDPTATPTVVASATSTPTPTATFDDVYATVDPSGAEVRFWHNHTGQRRTALQVIVAAFNAENRYGVVVYPIYAGGYTAIFNQMLPVLNTGEMPELVVAYANQAATYQVYGAVVDVRRLMDSPTWGLSADEQADFYPAFVTADTAMGGQQVGLSPNRSMEVMFYNSDWLTVLGVEAPPSTPTQFRGVSCAAVAQPFRGVVGESTGYALRLEASVFASWTFAFGGDVFDAEAGEYTFDSAAAVAAMTLLQGMVADGCATVMPGAYDDQAIFARGRALFTTGSSVGVPFYRRAVRESSGHGWGVAAIPHTTEQPVMNVYGGSLSIPRSTPEQELAAWLFLKYFTQPEVQAQWALASTYFPVRQSAVRREEMQAALAADSAYAAAFALLPYGKSEPATPGYDFVREAVVAAMAEMMAGADVEEMLGTLNARANTILAEQLGRVSP